jgi:HK97 family phage prohead protease
MTRLAPIAYTRHGHPLWPIAGGDGTDPAGDAAMAATLADPEQVGAQLRADNERDGQPWERPPRDNIVRALPDTPQLRDDAGDGMPTMLGHFAVFGRWTEIRSMWEGNFMESIDPGAFRKTFRELGKRIRVLLEHGRDPQAGNKPLGMPDELREDDTGAYYESELFDADYVRAIVPGLKAGAYGSSFRFAVIKDRWNKKPEPSDTNPRGLPEVVRTELAVPEFGPVTFPAYADATAGARSLTDDYLLARLGVDPDRLAMYLRDLRGAGEDHAASREPASTTPQAATVTSPLVTTRRAPSQADFTALLEGTR